MKSIRAGRGLGDSLYLQAVVRHLVKRDGLKLKVCSDWPDVFLPLGDRVQVVPFTRQGITILAHYTLRKPKEGSTQFQDCCKCAGITEDVEFKLDWPEARGELIDQVKASGKPVICVQLPRAPMGRSDGFGAELLPDCRVIQRAIDSLKDRATVVQIGAGQPLYQFQGIDIDLANKTTVAQMIDVASVARGMLGYCSFIVPLAECLDKPALLVWSRKGLRSGTPYIRQITPQKILHKPSSKWILDDALQDSIEESAHALLQ